MTPNNLTPEILVPKLGDYLIEKRIITVDQLHQALDVQKGFKSAGKNVLIGEVLIDLNLVDRRLLDECITEQILQLRNALQESNRTLEQRVIQRTIELQNALNKLAEMDKLKSNIIANISHELRTPLTHIKGYQELMLAGAMGELNPDQESTLKTIRKSTERLERLIEDLINFSQISRGDISLRYQPLDIKRIVNNVMKHSMPKAEEKSVNLVVEIPDDLTAPQGDEEKISWVIMQLIDNGIKFTPEKGTVSVSAVDDDYGARITVRDSGIGIPENKISTIFEPFHQLDSSSTRRYGGTGLGLSLVKQIIDAHNTSIQVTSEEGRFSQFSFIIPYLKPDKQETG